MMTNKWCLAAFLIAESDRRSISRDWWLAHCVDFGERQYC